MVRRPITFLALSVGTISLIIGAWIVRPRTTTAAGGHVSALQAVPAPSEWVAFDADIRTVTQLGGVTVVGRYYQASDGSTREETGPVKAPASVITINNVTTSTHYSYVHSQWHSYPMKLPAGGYRPGLRVVGRTHGLEESVEVIQGFSVYRATTSGGVVRMQAPALNFYPLRIEFEGTRQDCLNVVIREQPRELFEPPAGASVTPHDELRGIISNPTGRARGLQH